MSQQNHMRATWSAIKNAVRGDVNRAKRSFAEADTKAFAIKSTGCAMGCIIGAAGVYQFAKGFNDPQMNDEGVTESHINGTRVFVGALTSFFGAAALYVATQAAFKMPPRL